MDRYSCLILKQFGVWDVIEDMFSTLKASAISDQELKQVLTDPSAILNILPEIESILEDINRLAIIIRITSMSA